MSDNEKQVITDICKEFGKDRTRMMDIVTAVQEKLGCVSGTAMDLIAEEVSSHRVEVESVVSFYSFLTDKPMGQVKIRLCDDIIDSIYGSDKVAEGLKDELGLQFGLQFGKREAVVRLMPVAATRGQQQSPDEAEDKTHSGFLLLL